MYEVLKPLSTITYYFKHQPRCDFDLSKVPPCISHATIKAVQKEVNAIVSSQGDGSVEDGRVSLTKNKKGFLLKDFW